MKEMRFSVNGYVISHIGRVRLSHEDNFLLPDGFHIAPEEQKKICKDCEKQSVSAAVDTAVKHKDIYFAVVDGMGGHQSGETASYETVKNLWELLKCDKKKRTNEAVSDIISLVNHMVRELAGKTTGNNMGATLVLLRVGEDEYTVFNVGDSRAYVYSENGLIRLTKDHSEGQALFDSGLIDDEEIIKSRRGLTRYIGMPADIADSIADMSVTQKIRGGEIMLLCSDGLTDVLSDKEIELIIKTGKELTAHEIAKILLEASIKGGVERAGGIDNITVMIIKITDLNAYNEKKGALSRFLDKMRGIRDRVNR